MMALSSLVAELWRGLTSRMRKLAVPRPGASGTLTGSATWTSPDLAPYFAGKESSITGGSFDMDTPA